MRWGSFFVLAALLAWPCLWRKSRRNPKYASSTFRLLERLGHDMYAQDQAGWHATDAPAQHSF